MKKQIHTLFFVFFCFLFQSNMSGQCTLTCAGFIITLETTSTAISGSGSCIFYVNISHDNDGSLVGGDNGVWDFTNLSCIDCPNVPPNTTVVWEIWATNSNGSCEIGGPYTIGFTLSSCQSQLCNLNDAALPIELVSFSAESDSENNVLLNWQTASEINNEGFEIEHSMDARDWEAIDFVTGNGTVTDSREYSYMHKDAKLGTNYYRLKQLDFDGAYEYSYVAVSKLKSTHGTKRLTIMPNPSSAYSTITANLNTGMNGKLSVTNIMGQVIYETTVNSDQENYNFRLVNVTPGIYVVTVENGTTRLVEKLVIE